MADLLSPAITVISVGENDYGHPSHKVLNLLKKSRILRTDKHNSIKIRTDGEQYNIFTYNPEKRCWKKKI